MPSRAAAAGARSQPDREAPGAGGRLVNTYYDEGCRLLRAGDWVEAIRALAWSRDIAPDHAETYLALIEAYERCAAAEAEPDVLQQAWNVCRDLRDRRLPMTPEQQHAFRTAFVRVRDGIIAARAAGWAPPPPKEQVHTLFPKPSGSSRSGGPRSG